LIAMLTDARTRNYPAIQSYIDDLSSVLQALDTQAIARTIDALADAYLRGATVFMIGNGGSAATASHFACDLAKGVQPSGGHRFRAMALTDNVPLLTAWANDTSYERVFAEQLDNLINEGDVVIAISGSGNSPNVLNAMELARLRGAVTIGLTGFSGGKLQPLCDTCVVVPAERLDQIEDVHLALQHLMCSALRAQLARLAPR
jgi:D-sedoheptulose 7-phosphate isomerase